MKVFKLVYKVIVIGSVTYTMLKFMDPKTDKLIDNGAEPFTIGAGQMGISLATGIIAHHAIDKLL